MWILEGSVSDLGSSGSQSRQDCSVQLSGGSGVEGRYQRVLVSSQTLKLTLNQRAKAIIDNFSFSLSFALVLVFDRISSWPTIPQVYLEGEFVGGCDIMLQMHQSGELEKMLVKAKLVETEPGAEA